jgi:hypothetical protein
MSRAASVSSVYSSSSSNQRAAGRPDKVSDHDYRWRLTTRENFVIRLLLRRTKLAYGNVISQLVYDLLLIHEVYWIYVGFVTLS